MTLPGRFMENMLIGFVKHAVAHFAKKTLPEHTRKKISSGMKWFSWMAIAAVIVFFVFVMSSVCESFWKCF